MSKEFVPLSIHCNCKNCSKEGIALHAFDS